MDLPLNRKQNTFKSVWHQGHIGQAIIWPYNLPRPLFQIQAHLSTFYPTPVLGPKIVALFFSFAAAIEVWFSFYYSFVILIAAYKYISPRPIVALLVLDAVLAIVLWEIDIKLAN